MTISNKSHKSDIPEIQPSKFLVIKYNYQTMLLHKELLLMS